MGLRRVRCYTPVRDGRVLVGRVASGTPRAGRLVLGVRLAVLALGLLPALLDALLLGGDHVYEHMLATKTDFARP